jgi:alginate O-acetyltransferase complex protein AlgI
MIFNSFSFLIFFASVMAAHYATPDRHRWLVLLLASYFYYISVKPVTILLLMLTTITTYIFTTELNVETRESRKKAYLVCNLVFILMPLLFFKYLGDISEVLSKWFPWINGPRLSPMIHWPLPVGISFYSLMAIGYTIDVFNDEVKAEKNIGRLALFLSFFPIILSGPIERAKNMLPQFQKPIRFDGSKTLQGVKCMIWGYFAKLVVADRIGIYVDAVFNNVPQHNGTSLLAASVLYPLQVYADLGGYSLIAIGASYMLGIDVMQNFKRPFFADTMAEFWRRWHISLISWLTDYVFTPFSFMLRKFRIWGIVLSLNVTFLLSGLWHGAKANYLVWGLMQGLFLSAEAITNSGRTSLERRYRLNHRKWFVIVGCMATFVLFSASQILSRARDLEEAVEIFHKIFTEGGRLYIGTNAYFIYMLFGLVILFSRDFKDEFSHLKKGNERYMGKFVPYVKYAALVLIILLIGVFDGGQFIYFQF